MHFNILFTLKGRQLPQLHIVLLSHSDEYEFDHY